MRSIPKQIFERAERTPTAPAHSIKVNGRWQTASWSDYAAEARRATRALISRGVGPGTTVGILGFNTPSWVVFDVAAMAAGGAPAGIYTTSSSSEAAYILSHSESVVALVENAEQWAKIDDARSAAARGEGPTLDRLSLVVTMPGAEVIDDELVVTWDEFLALGDDVDDAEVTRRIEALEPDTLATLIYTSGTTGPPKGVMLSHENLRWTAEALRDHLGLESDGCGLSYLPLSHIAEQMTSIHGPAVSGAHVYFAESIETVAGNLREVQPTLMFGVPRIWEKFHSAVSSRLEQATGIKKGLLSWVKRTCTDYHQAITAGKNPSMVTSAQYQLARKLVLGKLHQALGLGRATVCVSGAAPIASEILEFFASLDVVILEVYGQSEDSGPTTINLPWSAKFGSVGRALPGVTVKIADDDEILVRGPNVFLGYFKDEAATAETLVDGWLLSGDLGALDAQGFLTITGRKKDIIITSGGKNIAPKNIESALKNHRLIAEAVVIGDQRKYLTALIALDREAAREAGFSGDLVGDERIRAQLQAALDDVNRDLARVETIKKFAILPRELTIADGDLTPTLKLKRAAVSDNFAELIDSMYQD